MSKTEVKKIAKRYAQKLKAENYPFSAVYVFGSQIEGKASRWSDIDVAVISDKLEKNWNQNEDTLWRYTMDIDPRIEPIGFTRADFQADYDPLVATIKKTGIKIA